MMMNLFNTTSDSAYSGAQQAPVKGIYEGLSQNMEKAINDDDKKMC